ncbi:hypothetical protein KHA96_17445 [Bacillus sp. FJAT-49711]|uniref:hypothetical protein n=1 Tax=Bacillus sp. FJAT-49711 TaxID=2833585 RepID=UPI001BC92215|nr:hypothetical protein [Bacillus sp. FJAT-49711]MBS4220100.1 hypothetical protein [Bacillus sp. FJAT-49711]
MTYLDTKHLLEKYKTKLQAIGGQNAKIKQIKHIQNGKKTDSDVLFAIEGI